MCMHSIHTHTHDHRRSQSLWLELAHAVAFKAGGWSHYIYNCRRCISHVGMMGRGVGARTTARARASRVPRSPEPAEGAAHPPLATRPAAPTR